MGYNTNALKSLLLYKSYSNDKPLRAIKAFDCYLDNKDKERVLSLQNDINSLYKFEYTLKEGKVYTVLFKETDDPEIYYHNDSSFSANIAVGFFEHPTVHISSFDTSSKQKNDLVEKLKNNMQYNAEDFDVHYKKAYADISFVSDLKPKIDEQIKKLPEEWQYLDLEIEYQNKKIVFQIPKLPFIFYALDKRYAGDDLNDFNIPNWKCITQSGWKCSGDNPYHTDWWTGLGFSPLAAYPSELFCENENVYQLVLDGIVDLKMDIQQKYWNFTSNSVGSKKYVSGDVMHYDDFKDDFSKIKPNSILILPNLNVEYETAIFAAIKNGLGGVISEKGGKLAHIAIVGREMEFPVFIEKNALQKYKWIKKVSLNGENGEIQLTPY